MEYEQFRSVRHISGALPMASLAKQEGYTTLFVRAEDAAQASLIEDTPSQKHPNEGRMNTSKHIIMLTAYEYRILKKNYLISTACKKQLESATTYEQDNEEVVELSMTLDELEDLTGYVAAESNHARTARQREELGAICDDFEARISEIKVRK